MVHQHERQLLVMLLVNVFLLLPLFSRLVILFILIPLLLFVNLVLHLFFLPSSPLLLLTYLLMIVMKLNSIVLKLFH